MSFATSQVDAFSLNCQRRQSAMSPGRVKTFLIRFESQDWSENRVPTQIFGLMINQMLADFT